jgi:hypothetical protein
VADSPPARRSSPASGLVSCRRRAPGCGLPRRQYPYRTRAAVSWREAREQLVATLVRRGATVGANATVVCGVTVGRHAFVAAGAVVVRDVADHALVAGNPAHRLGWVCACGQRLDERLSCGCGRSYRLVDEAAGLTPLAGRS